MVGKPIEVILKELHTSVTDLDECFVPRRTVAPGKPETTLLKHKQDFIRLFLLAFYDNITMGWSLQRQQNTIYLYLSLLSRSFSDHHLRCGGWLNLEFSKREKHSGWAIKTIYKKQIRGMLKHIPLDQ